MYIFLKILKRLFEFAFIRTALVSKLKKEEIPKILRQVDKFYKVIDNDDFREILEKIEFLIVDKKIDNFNSEELSTVIYMFSIHSHGCYALYELFRINFDKIF